MDVSSTHITFGVLRLLLEDARRWWYHRRLREQDSVAAARRRERMSVCRHIEDLRQGVVLHVGRGGWTLYRHQGRLRGHGDANDLFVRAARRAGVPILDTTTVAVERLRQLLCGPLPDQEPEGALEHARSLGATVYNVPVLSTDSEYPSTASQI
jgi:hypothetical protein